MMDRRLLLGAALLPFVAKAANFADDLERPATVIRPGGKPWMLRITRAGARLVAVGERGIVLWSDDDGNQWQQARVPVSVTLTCVQFISEQIGWAIGHGGVVLNTLDGGQTWTRQLDGRQINATALTGANEILTQQGENVVTSRAAKQAANAAQDGPDKPLLAMHFSDPLNGWVVGAFGLALTTSDGGRTWQSRANMLPNPKGLHYYALSRIGNQMVLAGEQGLLVSAAADSGIDSVLLSTPYRGSFFASSVLTDDSLLLGGLRGTLLLRNSAGTFKQLESGTERAILSIAPLPNGQLAVVDQAGRLLIGSLASGRLAPTVSQAERRLVSVTQARDGTLVGTGSFGVARLPKTKMISK